MKRVKDHLITILVIIFGIPIGLALAIIYLFVAAGIVILSTLITMANSLERSKYN